MYSKVIAKTYNQGLKPLKFTRYFLRIEMPACNWFGHKLLMDDITKEKVVLYIKNY